MDEGRLAAVRRRTDHNRKYVIVMNDIIKNRQEVYQNYLNKEQHGVESKIVAGELGLKRTIVRNNVLMQCLEARKEKMKTKNPTLPLGKYGGRPIHTFSRDIESMISWMHPRLRRLRQVERMKQNGLRLGAIIDPSTVPARIDAVFGERSNSDSRILAGQQTSRRKSSTRRRRLSKSGGLLDPLGRKPMVNRRRIEAPLPRTAFDPSLENDDLAKTTVNDSRRPSIAKANQSNNTSNFPNTSLERDEIKRLTPSGIPSMSTDDNARNSNGHGNARINSKLVTDEKELLHSRGHKGMLDFNKAASRRDSEKQNHCTSYKLAEAKNNNKSFPYQAADDPAKMTRRPTLILPPIKTSRNLVKK